MTRCFCLLVLLSPCFRVKRYDWGPARLGQDGGGRKGDPPFTDYPDQLKGNKQNPTQSSLRSGFFSRKALSKSVLGCFIHTHAHPHTHTHTHTRRFLTGVKQRVLSC